MMEVELYDPWAALRATEKDAPYSELDSKRWGIDTYRTYPASKNDLLEYQDSFVIARIDANRLDLVQFATKHGYFLCDTLTYWKGPCAGVGYKSLPVGYHMRPIKPSDDLAPLAKESFADYLGHYHADPKTKPQAEAVYVEWTEALKTHGVVIEHEGKIVAYGEFSAPCDLTLGGVDKAHNGKGLYTAFARACARWGNSNRVGEITISTQITNLAVQKVWTRMGLVPYKHVYTLHRWP